MGTLRTPSTVLFSSNANSEKRRCSLVNLAWSGVRRSTVVWFEQRERHVTVAEINYKMLCSSEEKLRMFCMSCGLWTDKTGYHANSLTAMLVYFFKSKNPGCHFAEVTNILTTSIWCFSSVYLWSSWLAIKYFAVIYLQTIYFNTTQRKGEMWYFLLM